jgi:hypothetical protein
MCKESDLSHIHYPAEYALILGLEEARKKMVERMKSGEILISHDISLLMQERLDLKSSNWVTSTMNESRRVPGFPDLRVGSGKYRGSRFYFDASIEPERLDFDVVVKRIDLKKPLLTPSW